MTLHNREFVLEQPHQLKALADETRATILRVLEDKPASAKQLSELLQLSHGKIGHHMKVLREAGLIEVVEERPVRAVTERIYGLSYDRLRYGVGGGGRLEFLFAQAAREASPESEQPFDPPGVLYTVKMSGERARAFHARLVELTQEFAEAEQSGASQVFGIAASVFLTDTPAVKE